MSITLPQPSDTAAEKQDSGLRPYRWTREEYYRMADLGLLQPDAHTELLDGEIIQNVSPVGKSHRVTVYRVTAALRTVFQSGFYVDHEIPVILADNSEPEPDIVVAVGQVTDYDPHPRPADIRLLVEVSDATLAADRARKARAYARAGIADYWIVNLTDLRLEVYRDPSPGGVYRRVNAYLGTETVTPLAMPEALIFVADLLPPSNI